MRVKTWLLRLFSAFLIFPLYAHAHKHVDCELALAPGTILATDMFKDYLKLSTGAEIFVRIQQPRIGVVRGWYLMIHGLMDSHRAYDDVADSLLHRGFGIVRMDLRGFARSLHREYLLAEAKDENYLPPAYIGYREQVEDLKALLHELRNRFNIHRPNVVGHSMGGGLALALLADPEAVSFVGPRTVVVAPYIYRLEFFLAEKFAPLGLDTLNAIPDLDSWVPGFMKMGREFVMDLMVSNTQMRIQFGEFFDQLAEKRLPPIPDSDWNKIKARHVDAAIAMVKGLRDLNSLHMVSKIPEHIQVDLIYGEDDQLIEAALARKLARVLQKRGGQVFPLKAGHFVLETASPQVVKILAR